jgi:uncharacterized glyoxalase superfamily protein PhnB
MAARPKRSARVSSRKPKAAARPRKRVQAIPPGYAGITPSLVVRNAEQAIEFYRKAFGARETMRFAGPGGKIMHAEMKVFDHMVMLSDEAPDQGKLAPESLKGSPVSLFVYTRDVDAAIAKAVDAGATVKMEAQDMFWGDRFGVIGDPFGHQWQIATHKEDVTPREIRKRWAAMMAQPAT